MSWGNAIKKIKAMAEAAMVRPDIVPGVVDWNRLVTVDFETYFDVAYTLSKLSTSEYIRDPRFKAQMVGIKIGRKPTKWYPHAKVKTALQTINWSTHSLLCHNTAFDGFIMSHHYGIVPVKYYDTLSMARGLHSNEIGASLDEVAQHYGKGSKIEGVLELTKGVLNWSKPMIEQTAKYCVQDVDLTFEIFQEMHAKFPADELDLVDLTIRMFCDPVLKVDLPRVEVELKRELDRREKLFYDTLDPAPYYDDKTVLKTKAERALTGLERDMLVIKRVIGSNGKYSELLRAEGIDPPMKPSPAYIKLSKDEKELVEEEDKWVYSFSKDSAEFTTIPDDIDMWRGALDPNKKKDVPLISAKQDRLRNLVECRLAVKSTTNMTRAQRFLTAGANGMSLPVGYAYYRAHTGRWGGNNKMNMQNLTRGGELRLSILAPKGHQLCVVDSGQIEARVNGWLWGQDDLMDAFRMSDTWDKSKGTARGTDRDAYCRFGDQVYGREITTEDKMERFVGKVCVAEGELVLTDRGLVPINLISKVDRLWDGVEWVHHDGVIDQGIREVITYDGLTATPDHEVFTEDGRIVPLGQAASEMVRLQRTGAEGQSIRFCDNHVVADTPRKRLSVRVGPLQSEWSQKTDLPQQLEERQDNIIPEEWATASGPRQGFGATIRRYLGTLYRPITQALGKLWRTRDQVFVQDPNGFHSVGVGEPPAQRLQGCGDRQDGQRRALRAGEFKVSDTVGEYTEPTQYSEDHVVGQTLDIGRFPEPLQQNLDLQVRGAAGAYRGANLRQVRVFDIANAGPRLRYTVSDKLVFNCVLGLGFQMGAPKFQMTLAKGALGGPPVFFELDRCKDIVNKYRRMNYRIEQGWKKCAAIIEDMAAGRTGKYGPITWEKETLWLPNGMSLKYPDLRKRVGDKGWDEWSYQAGDMRAKIYGGLLCENIVQALARIIVGWQMLQISRKYRVVMTTHDEVVAMPKTREAQKCFELMTKIMSTPPDWCKSIPLNCEGGFDVNYSK
jgi:hypothetical protein